MQYQSAVQAAYQQLQADLDCQVLGLIEIGSYARNEAVTWSDRDLRLVVQSEAPYLLLREHPWTDDLPTPVSYVDWAEINRFAPVTFGLTNLAFVEAAIQAGKFPLNDHTSLYQGQILLDETRVIAAFCQRNQGRKFANIGPDYHRQLRWRVNRYLSVAEEQQPIKLDEHKQAIPIIHTCCRIMRDIANIESYQTQAVYLQGFAALTRYYQKRWPEFLDLFQTAFRLKRDEQQRRLAFTNIKNSDKAWTSRIYQIVEDTRTLWMRFKQD